MERQIITYKQCVDLGFKRTNENDSQWFNQYGYDWFLVEKYINKHLYFSWDCETRFVDLIRHNKECDILGKIPVRNLQHLKELIHFFTNKENKKYNYTEMA